jgi:hypothetical protein
MLGEKGFLLGALLAATGCNLVTGASDLNVTGSGGAGGGGGNAATTSSSHATTTSSTTSGSTSSTSATTTASTTASTGSGTTDPYAQYRQACIDKINALRATKGLSPYTRWTDNEACVDQQATHDSMVNKAHDAFINGTPKCGGYGQNECPGWSASSIESCLDQMWNEKDQPGCSGCDACDTFTIFNNNCPNCSFNGSTVCGHYVNMSSKSFTLAACGFSMDGTWEAINFQ